MRCGRSLTRRRRRVRHLDVDVEVADVLAERDEVVVREVLDLGELRAFTPAPAQARDDQQQSRDAEDDEQQDEAGAAAALANCAAVSTGRAGPADAVHELEQYRQGALVAVFSERLPREAAGFATRQDAARRARAQRPADE